MESGGRVIPRSSGAGEAEGRIIPRSGDHLATPLPDRIPADLTQPDQIYPPRDSHGKPPSFGGASVPANPELDPATGQLTPAAAGPPPEIQALVAQGKTMADAVAEVYPPPAPGSKVDLGNGQYAVFLGDRVGGLPGASAEQSGRTVPTSKGEIQWGRRS
jgi:hypothetical protein